MKKILVAGIATGALAAATSAGAVVLTGTVGGVTTTSAVPYTIAAETVSSGLTQAAVGGTTLTDTFAAAQSVAPAANGATTPTVYQVTYNLTGGATFKTGIAPTAALTGFAAGAAGGGNAAGAAGINGGCTLSTATATQEIFLCSITPATAGTAPTTTAAGATTFTGVALSTAITLASTQSAASSTSLVSIGQGGGYTPVDGGQSNSLTVVTFAAAVSSTPFTAPQTVYASLNSTPQYQAFNTSATATTGDSASATLATFNPVLNSATPAVAATLAGGTYKVDLNGTNVGSVATIVQTDTVAITGPNAANLTASLAGTSPASVSATGPTANFVINQTTAPNGPFTLTEPSTKVTIVPGSYSATTSYTAQAGFTAPATVTQAVGTVSTQGTSIVAPWVGDGSNNYQGVIRISNLTNAVLPAFTVTLLNPVNSIAGSPNPTGTCTIPAPGTPTTTVSSAMLNNCFGSFGNSDVRITLPTAATSLTAKLRIINASTGVVTEQSIGSGQQVTFGIFTGNTIQ